MYNKFERLEVEETGQEWVDDNIATEPIQTQKRKRKNKTVKDPNTKLETIEEKNETKSESQSDSGDNSGISSSSENEIEDEEKSEESTDESTEAGIKQEIAVNVTKFTELQPSKLMTINLKIKDAEVAAILDTGSDTNMMCKSVAQYFNLNTNTDKCKTFRGLGQAELKTLGQVKVPFALAGLNIEDTPFDVVEEHIITKGAILGRKLIAKKNIVIDDANNRISIPVWRPDLRIVFK